MHIRWLIEGGGCGRTDGAGILICVPLAFLKRVCESPCILDGLDREREIYKWIDGVGILFCVPLTFLKRVCGSACIVDESACIVDDSEGGGEREEM